MGKGFRFNVLGTRNYKVGFKDFGLAFMLHGLMYYMK
jgi:hypothetical protein